MQSYLKQCTRLFIYLAPVVQELDGTVHWINHYQPDKSIDFGSTCPLDNDLTTVQHYPLNKSLFIGQLDRI